MAIVVNVDNGRLLLATNFSAFCQAFPQKNYALVVSRPLHNLRLDKSDHAILA